MTGLNELCEWEHVVARSPAAAAVAQAGQGRAGQDRTVKCRCCVVWSACCMSCGVCHVVTGLSSDGRAADCNE